MNELLRMAVGYVLRRVSGQVVPEAAQAELTAIISDLANGVGLDAATRFSVQEKLETVLQKWGL